MKKYNLLLFLCIIPTIFSSRIVKRRRRPTIEQQRSILDQIAQSNTWQSPNRVISASYARNPGTGHVNNANLMINLLPHNEQHHSVDLVASQTLSNAQSAVEYVTRALEMRKNLRDKAPHSSYVKYDIYEKEKKQFIRPLHDYPSVMQNSNTKSDTVTRSSMIHDDYRTQKLNNKSDTVTGSSVIYGNYHTQKPNTKSDSTTRSSVIYGDYHTQKPNTKSDSTTRSSVIYGDYHTQKPNTKSDSITRNSKIYEDFRKPDYSDDFGEGEYMYRESNHKYNGNYDNFQSDVKELTESGIPKAELMKHIEKSVVQYMKRLESEGNLPKVPKHRPHTEVKMYYRLPKLNSGEKEKDFTYSSTESELFKPSPTKHYKSFKSPHKSTLTTVATSYPDEPYSSVVPNIDLTIRNKRPKSIDYSALDIGQSWSHGSSLDLHTTVKPKLKPKLKFNSQTYQDINAMTYSPGKGLLLDEPAYGQSSNQPCTSASEEIGQYVTKPRYGVANVGATLAVGDNPDEAIKDLQEHYQKPVQVFNGVPVVNPYKVNSDTLKHIFGGDPEEIGKDNWKPYSPSDHRHQQSPKETTASSNTQSQQLPADSYNPKYNNNPEGQGYQDHWQPPENSHRQRGTIGSEMHASSSSTLPKKIRTATTVTIHKRKKKKNKTKIIKIVPKTKNNLLTELRPPPAQTK